MSICKMWRVVGLLIFLGLTVAQNFGSIFNRSNVIVNVIDANEAESYQKRKLNT